MVQPPLGQLQLDGNIEWVSRVGAQFDYQSPSIIHGSPWCFLTVVEYLLFSVSLLDLLGYPVQVSAP